MCLLSVSFRSSYNRLILSSMQMRSKAEKHPAEVGGRHHKKQQKPKHGSQKSRSRSKKQVLTSFNSLGCDEELFQGTKVGEDGASVVLGDNAAAARDLLRADGHPSVRWYHGTPRHRLAALLTSCQQPGGGKYQQHAVFLAQTPDHAGAYAGRDGPVVEYEVFDPKKYCTENNDTVQCREPSLMFPTKVLPNPRPKSALFRSKTGGVLA
jgi:hypothetical protein